MRVDYKFSSGPEIRGRRTLQELCDECEVWDYITDARSDEELAFELSWNRGYWEEVIGVDSDTAVLPTDVRWG